LVRIRDYLIALAGLAVFTTACRTREDFWAILGTATVAFPVYAVWVVYRLRTRGGWPLWMPHVLAAAMTMWCWVVFGLNVLQPTEEELTLARAWLGLLAFLVLLDLTRLGPRRLVSAQDQ
jgi:hypothetical protein